MDVNTSRVVPPLSTTELRSIYQSVTSRYPKGTSTRSSAATHHYVDAGNYICQAIRQYSVQRKNRESQVVEWQDINSGHVFLQYFNTYSRFSVRSKAVVNYVLLFRELPRRLDRLDFARFVGRTALVRISNSKPSVEWLRQFPGLTMPEALTESRVADVICPLQRAVTKYPKGDAEGRYG